MKKPGNESKKGVIGISATLVQPGLLKNLVEELANRRPYKGYCYENLHAGWIAVDTSSLEAHVSGNISLLCKNDFISMPFVSCFLFTCTKGKGQAYNLVWVSSLS